MFYAQLNPANHICVGLIESDEELDLPRYTKIPVYSLNLIGKVFNYTTKTFSDDPQIATVMPPVQSDTELSIMEAIADNYEASQKVQESNVEIMSAIADLYESTTVTDTAGTKEVTNG